MIRFFLLILCLSLINFNTSTKEIGSSTGYKIPRFVSIKSDEANLRIGSSKNYPIILQYKIKDMPVEIIDEYENWRKVIDIKDNTGWIHKSLIHGKKTGIISSSQKGIIHIYNKSDGNIIGEINQGIIVKVTSCKVNWCLISYNNFKGWIEKKFVWGVKENEQFNVGIIQMLIDLNFGLINFISNNYKRFY